MRIHSILAKNYRPFAALEEIRVGSLATIVGQNDAGKSSILRALQLFFESRPKIEESDVHDGANSTDDVIIEVAFTLLPETIELEEGIKTTLQEEMLLDTDGYLRIRKTYPRSNLTKFSITLITHDFENDNFAGVATLKESQLNQRCTSNGIDVTRSGRGITNKDKRKALRAKAREENTLLGRRKLPLTIRDNLWKKIESILPEFEIFETDTRLGVGETKFQSQFRPIVKTAAELSDVVDIRDTFIEVISQALQSEVDKIFKRLQQYTDAFIGLIARPEFNWEKAVTFEIFGRDQHDVENSLDRRGSGMRRLLMVAFFQYLAEKKRENGDKFIFAVEEPENCLHPGLQRELVKSFRQLADKGYQVIVTSHSPIFAGNSPIEDLALVIRTEGIAKVIQAPDLSLSDIARQLGVEPADQITGYNACIFVEGPNDIEFWKAVVSKFKDAGKISEDFDDKQIGFIICGGDNLKHWMDRQAMHRLNRHFGVVVDSDRKSQQHNIPGRKLNWKRKCEAQDGVFFILHKREIENYLHPMAIERSGCTLTAYDDYSDMKQIFGENIFKVIRDMSCDEILEKDRYEIDGIQFHELLDITQAFLTLPDN